MLLCRKESANRPNTNALSVAGCFRSLQLGSPNLFRVHCCFPSFSFHSLQNFATLTGIFFFSFFSSEGDALLWNSNFQKKPAYQATLDAIVNYKPPEKPAEPETPAEGEETPGSSAAPAEPTAATP